LGANETLKGYGHGFLSDFTQNFLLYIYILLTLWSEYIYCAIVFFERLRSQTLHQAAAMAKVLHDLDAPPPPSPPQCPNPVHNHHHHQRFSSDPSSLDDWLLTSSTFRSDFDASPHHPSLPSTAPPSLTLPQDYPSSAAFSRPTEACPSCRQIRPRSGGPASLNVSMTAPSVDVGAPDVNKPRAASLPDGDVAAAGGVGLADDFSDCPALGFLNFQVRY
jgi:hypothetical protein